MDGKNVYSQKFLTRMVIGEYCAHANGRRKELIETRGECI